VLALEIFEMASDFIRVFDVPETELAVSLHFLSMPAQAFFPSQLDKKIGVAFCHGCPALACLKKIETDLRRCANGSGCINEVAATGDGLNYTGVPLLTMFGEQLQAHLEGEGGGLGTDKKIVVIGRPISKGPYLVA
jgi:hypothetical protein